MSKKNILIISAVFPPEPVVSAMLSCDLAEELSKNNKVTVLCPQPTRPEGFVFKNDYNALDFNVIKQDSFTCSASSLLGRLRESYSFGKQCKRYIKKNSKQLDCIYINSWPLISQYLIIKNANRLNIPCVMHVQDIYPESLLNVLLVGKQIINKILLPIDKYVLQNSTSIIAISENMKQFLVKSRNLLPGKVSVVSNWQDEEVFISFKSSTEIGITDLSKPFTFMYLGNVGPLAGVDLLINSFFNAQIQNSKLIIAGSGSRTNACQELVKSLNADNIEFMSVPEGMVPLVQEKADVMLLPVKKYGAMSSIPSKLPAYMFSAKPIIGSLDLESDTAKAIKESGCGIVVKPENEVELIKAMKNVSEWNIQTRNEKGNLGFEYAMSHFSKKKNLNKIITVIDRILKKNVNEIQDR